MFTHCYAGEVGSVHDAKVLSNSEIWSYMHNQRDEKFPDDTHILGDKAYPCLPTLITPFKDNGHLTVEQLRLNYNLSAVRSTIERTFALLKKRWRCMKFLDVRSLVWIPRYILACCVLHNICIMQNDILEVELIRPENDGNDNIIAENVMVDREFRRHGAAKRERLCQIINQ